MKTAKTAKIGRKDEKARKSAFNFDLCGVFVGGAIGKYRPKTPNLVGADL